MSPHMEHMWRGLPEEILVSKVLPRLPMASLWRFRAVCKKWNALPTQSDFATQHALASHALASSMEEEFVLINFEQEFVVVTLQSMQPVNSLKGWNVLDVANSRVFPVTHADLVTQVEYGNLIPRNQRRFLAADGGLLLFGNSNDPSLIVCNPILKVVKVIPWPLDKWSLYKPHVMITDTVSMEYEILVFHPMEYHYQTKYMDVFESKTGRWRRVMNTSVPPSSPRRLCKKSKVVKFKNALYQLHSGSNDEKPYLIEFDKTTGIGSILDFPELFLGIKDCTRAHTLELVVSLGRLFCVYRPPRNEAQNNEHNDDYLEVFEIFPKQHLWESLVMMPKALMHWLDSYNFNSYMDLDEGLDRVVPIGCTLVILFCSNVVGWFVTYDPASKSWHQYSHTWVPDFHQIPRLYVPCTSFNLSLCPP